MSETKHMADESKWFLKEQGEDTGYIGTKREIAEQYIEDKGWEISFSPLEDEDGYRAELLDSDDEVIADEFSDADNDNDEAVINSIYEQLIEHFARNNAGDYIFCEVMDAECFIMDYETLLKEKITAWDVWDAGLDLDDEQSVREWYYDVKVEH